MSSYKKIIIIGNSGSGKTFLAKEISSALSIPVIHLDDLFWTDKTCSQKRSKDQVLNKLAEYSQKDQWIIEGIFGDLIKIPLHKADCLIFLDMDWTTCSEGLTQRGAQSSSASDFKALLDWAEQYWERDSSASYKLHLSIYHEFNGKKFLLKSRNEVLEWIKGQI